VCPAFPTCLSVFIPEPQAKSTALFSLENSGKRVPSPSGTRPEWQSLNLRLSTPVSSANITPFTAMNCGLSHASDASQELPGSAPWLVVGNQAVLCVKQHTRRGPSIQDED
jgi:hypothetical protein